MKLASSSACTLFLNHNISSIRTVPSLHQLFLPRVKLTHLVPALKMETRNPASLSTHVIQEHQTLKYNSTIAQLRRAPLVSEKESISHKKFHLLSPVIPSDDVQADRRAAWLYPGLWLFSTAQPGYGLAWPFCLQTRPCLPFNSGHMPTSKLSSSVFSAFSLFSRLLWFLRGLSDITGGRKQAF